MKSFIFSAGISSCLASILLAAGFGIPAAASKDIANQLQFTAAYGSSAARKSGRKHQSQSIELIKVLHSKLPEPDQASLDQLIKNSNRLKIYAGGQFNGKPVSKLILFDSKDPELLDSLLKALQVEDHADSFNQYLDAGGPTIELLKNNKRLAVLSFIHPDGLRWQKKWKFDSTLREPRQLIEWLASHNVDGPKLAFEAQVKDKRRSSADLQKWIMSMPAMPECLKQKAASYDRIQAWVSISGSANDGTQPRAQQSTETQRFN